MRDDLYATLTLISSQLEAMINDAGDGPLKPQLEGVYQNVLSALTKVNDPNYVVATNQHTDIPLTLDQELIARAVRYIGDNLQNPLYSVMQLSKDMNMDRTGLYRKLVAITGLAPTMFIRAIRLKKAVLLLNQKRYSQGEIAEKVGFNNAAYFSKCFKEEYGVSPSQYCAE